MLILLTTCPHPYSQSFDLWETQENWIKNAATLLRLWTVGDDSQQNREIEEKEREEMQNSCSCKNRG